MPDFAEQLVMSDAPVLEQPAPAPEPQAAPAAAPVSDDRPRNPDGTFAPKAKSESEAGVKQEPAPQKDAAQAAPEPPTDAEPPHVPRTALLDERRKRQALEAELAELRKPKPTESPQQPTPQTPQPPATPKGPDFSFDETEFQDDPQGREGLFNARIHRNKMEMSTLVATQQFGEAAVNEAWTAFDQACKTDPKVNAWSFSNELRNSVHPIGQIVQWHKQQQEIGRLTEAGGLEKLTEQIRAKLMAEMGSAQPQPMTAAVAAPTVVPMPKPSAPETPPSLAKGGAGSNNAPEIIPDNELLLKMFPGSNRQPRKR